MRFLGEFPFCIVCQVFAATMIDHIIPVHQGVGELCGPNDPLFWEPWNHQPLCRQHHAIKTTTCDVRLTNSRVWLLSHLTEQETDPRRNQLIRLSEIWEQWVDLGTGVVMRLEP